MTRRSFILFFCLLVNVNFPDVSAQQSSGFKVSRLSFNLSAFNEISPVIFKDGLLFCSDRRFSGFTDRTSFDGRRLYNIFYAERIDSMLWERPQEVKSERTALFNNGPLCFAPDGKTVYFTSEVETGIPSKNRRFRNRSGIFVADLSGLELISIRPFKYNNPQYDIGQPSISSDGRYLFFASDMPGGSGGSDIYYCEMVSGEWSDPVNLGPSVNSPGVDNYPHYQAGRLYFTSDRPEGIGGLDIYYTIRNIAGWDAPVLLPEPVNSASDDFAFVTHESLQSGFFASNRRRNDDIYEFSSTIVRKARCQTQEENNYCYEFVEENAVKFDTIPFRYEWKFGDGNKGVGPVVNHCYAGPGTYKVQLDVVNLVTQEISENIKSSILVVEDIEQPYITCPDTYITGMNATFSAENTNLPGWDITSYYWNFGDETIAVGKSVEKQYSKPGTYEIQLIISARPDAGGVAREACVSRNITISQP